VQITVVCLCYLAGILARAEGLAILTVVKVGFLVTARAGSGIVIAKLGQRSQSFLCRGYLLFTPPQNVFLVVPASLQLYSQLCCRLRYDVSSIFSHQFNPGRIIWKRHMYNISPNCKSESRS